MCSKGLSRRVKSATKQESEFARLTKLEASHLMGSRSQLIDDSFQKFVITEDPIKKYQNEDGVVFMNIFDFLLDDKSLVL